MYPSANADGTTALTRAQTQIYSRPNSMSEAQQTTRSRAEAPGRSGTKTLKRVRWIALIIGFALLYVFYIDGLSTNPPGFYVDESAIAYNAYCIAHTGANEFGTHFPLFFPVYTDGWTQYANPTQIYLLAVLFKVFKPSILLVRVYAASWVFLA